MGAPLSIGAGCTIGHKAILHGCTIGENSLVGMGHAILNHADRCELPRRRQCARHRGQGVPDNSLIVGAPAKAIRVLDEQAAEQLRLSAISYVENWKHFAQKSKADRLIRLRRGCGLTNRRPGAGLAAVRGRGRRRRCRRATPADRVLALALDVDA